MITCDYKAGGSIPCQAKAALLIHSLKSSVSTLQATIVIAANLVEVVVIRESSTSLSSCMFALAFSF